MSFIDSLIKFEPISPSKPIWNQLGTIASAKKPTLKWTETVLFGTTEFKLNEKVTTTIHWEDVISKVSWKVIEIQHFLRNYDGNQQNSNKTVSFIISRNFSWSTN